MTASNETIFKSSLSLFDDLEYVVAKNRLEKDETLEATAERASRHAEGRPWLTIHYTHKIYP